MTYTEKYFCLFPQEIPYPQSIVAYVSLEDILYACVSVLIIIKIPLYLLQGMEWFYWYLPAQIYKKFKGRVIWLQLFGSLGSVIIIILLP